MSQPDRPNRKRHRKRQLHALLDHVLPSLLAGATMNMILTVLIFAQVMTMPPTSAPAPWVMFLIGLLTGALLVVDTLIILRAVRARRATRQQLPAKSRHTVP